MSLDRSDGITAFNNENDSDLYHEPYFTASANGATGSVYQQYSMPAGDRNQVLYLEFGNSISWGGHFY